MVVKNEDKKNNKTLNYFISINLDAFFINLVEKVVEVVDQEA